MASSTKSKNGNSIDRTPLERPTPLQEMIIGSVDTLCGTEINQSIPSTWNDRPPLLDKVGRNGVMIQETETLLKGMIRLGIPPALRCAIQLSNVIQRVHYQQQHPPQYWYEYRTLAKVRALDNAYDSLLQRILSSPNDSDGIGSTVENSSNNSGNNKAPTHSLYNSTWESMQVSMYGRLESRDITKLLPGTITPSGFFSLKRVLIAIEQCIGVEYAPLIPVIASILLTSMSESYAFTAIREMGHCVAYYFPSSRIEHAAWCYAFGDILRKLHPQTATYLEDRGVLDIDGLSPIFQDFFLDVLPFSYVQRIMDIYTLEGSKVLFRFGVALLVLYKVESAEQLITISTADEWWYTMKLWAYSTRFHFDYVVRKAYGVHGHRGGVVSTGLRRQLRFPRRAIIQRMIRIHEDRITSNDQLNEDGIYQEAPARPLGLVHPQPLPPDSYGNPGETVHALLLKSVQSRQHIAQWLPLTLRLTNLNLIYSTNYHGRTLERFYEHVKYTKHTLVVCEVLLPLPTSKRRSNVTTTTMEPTMSCSNCIIGMYASQNWRISSQLYGDGGCFLFRLEPDAKSWKWQPTTPLDDLEYDETNNSNNRTALLEQFMVGTKDYISMGGNPDGTCGLRINEDLTKGESSAADGFNNEPLHISGVGNGGGGVNNHSSSSSLFEIGLVEVYGLVRQIDGRPV